MHAMSVKSLMFLTSALVTAALVIEPLAANAAGLHQTGTWGRPTSVAVSNLRCGGVPGVGSISTRPLNMPGVGNVSAFRPAPGVNSGNREFSMRRNFDGARIGESARAAFGSRPLNVTGGADASLPAAESAGGSGGFSAGGSSGPPRPFMHSSRPLNVQGYDGGARINVTNNFKFKTKRLQKLEKGIMQVT